MKFYTSAMRRTSVQYFTRLQLTACSRGPPATAGLLVIICGTQYTELMCNITNIYLPTSPTYCCFMLYVLSVCRSVCLCVGHIGEPCKMTEPIEMPLGMWTRVGQGTTYWIGTRIPSEKEHFVCTCPDRPAGRYAQSDSAGGSTRRCGLTLALL